jgi:hypothetical protein
MKHERRTRTRVSDRPGVEMVMRLLVWLSLLGSIAACAPTTESQERLAYACEVKKCRCVAQSKTMFSKARYADVLWRENGTAYCAEGQYLEFAEEPK